ncbi:hypothetical protein IQ249_16795 [Lusitaniella coriacea LEGE 07157]|uniref:S1 motif domain-containing protein n=1 Tax=Lusitaniella coriacea LEGE 07157 TaxID=945747 RepID=A0A8J7DZT1_9CYAN|nr:S1 RNA-binding domain-containing protein [Lusitaniella coriacea]MBE9117558.1 hypothetical protein [Lusitaniella coriacea LEGE 07157]
MDLQIENCLSNTLKLGDIVAGTVINIELNGAWIDVGIEKLIFVAGKYISFWEPNSITEILTTGEIREFIVVKDYNREGNWQLALSLENLESEKSYKRIEQLEAEDITIYAKVITAYPYGVLVNVESQPFIISNIHLSTDIPNTDLVGTTIPLKFIPNTLCLSHRLAVQNQEANKNDSSPQKNYVPGDIVIGKVIQLESDCAWIDIGLEKLAYLHISQMWNRPFHKIKLTQDILYLNQVRDFEIVYESLHPGTRLSLSIREIHRKIIAKRLQQIYSEDITIHAPVIGIARKGAVVDIEELSGCIPPFLLGFDLHSENIVGKILPLKLFYSTTNYERVEDFLSFTPIHDCPKVKDRIAKFKVGKIVIAKVKAIREYGVIVNMNCDDIENLSALLRSDNISQVPIDDLDSVFKIGEEIKAIIIYVGSEMARFSLSTKVLESELGQMLKNPQEVYKNAEEMAKSLALLD